MNGKKNLSMNNILWVICNLQLICRQFFIIFCQFGLLWSQSKSDWNEEHESKAEDVWILKLSEEYRLTNTDKRKPLTEA